MQLLPALNSVGLATVRGERQFDMLQCVEAIRLYAAAHDGTLPDSLEALTESPAPLDPATGKPYEYRRDGASATLIAPIPPGAPNNTNYRLHYELKLAR
jgi:hypothetical protein